MRHDPERVDAVGRVTVVLLVAVFAAVVFHQAVRPLMAARRDLGAFRDAVEILADAEGSVDRLDREIRSVETEIAESRALLPRTVNLDGFLEYVGKAAGETETRIEKLTPKVPVEHRLYMELPVEVRVTGPFLSVYDLLIELEHGSRLCRIDRMKIESDREGKCRAEMTLSLFFAREDGA
ncbi:MAG: type 4a pilus biogenesis protein PilO [Candidatus Eisenbacteria bacterium]